jgi:quercetin dioxygenase-like cupin family protein
MALAARARQVHGGVMTVSQRDPVVMPAAAIAKAQFEPLGPTVPATHAVLWRDDTSMAGVLVLAAGQRLGEHTHRRNHHHLWVVDGEVVILGERLGAGSYVHVPSGVVHDIDATATNGCRVFYLYLEPPGP